MKSLHIELHNTEVLKRWTTKQGMLLRGAVLVEFSLCTGKGNAEVHRSRLIEQVAFWMGPDRSKTVKNIRFEQRAFRQVKRYFDGAGERENLFHEVPVQQTDHRLSPDQEAELQRELRSIEREFAAAV